MILIEPDAATLANQIELRAGGLALNVPELRTFLTKAKSVVGLRGEVSVLLATDATVRALNRDFRRKDKATDVLSFPVDGFPGERSKPVGDLAISIETAQSQADEHGHSLQVEVKILMLHGLLHLAGYDHETDNGQMEREESALRKRLDLPVGLIQRSTRGAAKKNAARKARGRGR